MHDFNRFFLVFLGVLVLLTLLSKPLWAYDPAEATRVLSAQGYTSIQIDGYALFACDKYDFWQTEFRATAPNGTKVSGAVCRGMFFKANTVRLY